MANFRLVEHLSHLVVQPSDVRLNPPEGYLFVQDGLIISCGVLYALMYAFAMVSVVRDRVLPGSVKYLSLTLAYEFYYAFTTTSTFTEQACFLVWFALDLAFVGLALWQVYSPAQRHRIVTEMTMFYFPLALGALKCLSTLYPDERQQVTAYWTGIFLQLPVGWVYVYRLLADRSTRGQSLEMWLVRYLGCFTAYGVFIWRYLNVPRNWGYVGSFWSIGVIVATLVPETVYPFVYFWVWKGSEKRKVKVG